MSMEVKVELYTRSVTTFERAGKIVESSDLREDKLIEIVELSI